MKVTQSCILLVALAGVSTATPVNLLSKRVEGVSAAQVPAMDDAEYYECMRLSGLEDALPCYKEARVAAIEQHLSVVLGQLIYEAHVAGEFELNITNCLGAFGLGSVQCLTQESLTVPLSNFNRQFFTNTLNDGCSDGVKAAAAAIAGNDVYETVIDSVSSVGQVELDVFEDMRDTCESISPGMTTTLIPTFAGANGSNNNSAGLPEVSVLLLLLAIAQAL